MGAIRPRGGSACIPLGPRETCHHFSKVGGRGGSPPRRLRRKPCLWPPQQVTRCLRRNLPHGRVRLGQGSWVPREILGRNTTRPTESGEGVLGTIDLGYPRRGQYPGALDRRRPFLWPSAAKVTRSGWLVVSGFGSTWTPTWRQLGLKNGPKSMKIEKMRPSQEDFNS